MKMNGSIKNCCLVHKCGNNNGMVGMVSDLNGNVYDGLNN